MRFQFGGDIAKIENKYRVVKTTVIKSTRRRTAYLTVWIISVKRWSKVARAWPHPLIPVPFRLGGLRPYPKP